MRLSRARARTATKSLAVVAIDDAVWRGGCEGDDCRAFPHGRARRVCIIAVRLPPVAVYSSLTPAIFGLDPGGSGPFSWVRQGASRLSPPSCRPGLSAGRAAGRLFVCRRWPAVAGQVGRHRRPHHRQSWSAEKSTSRTAYKPFSRHRRGLGLPDSQKRRLGRHIAPGKPFRPFRPSTRLRPLFLEDRFSDLGDSPAVVQPRAHAPG